MKYVKSFAEVVLSKKTKADVSAAERHQAHLLAQKEEAAKNQFIGNLPKGERDLAREMLALQQEIESIE